jgi:hypothetical protein
LCSLLQTHFNHMPTSDDTFHAKLESLMDEYLTLWILDRFSTEAAKMALAVRQRDKYLEIIYNQDSSIRISKQASSMLSVTVLDDVINVPFAPSFDADIRTALHEAMERISKYFYSLLESILTPFGFIQHTDYMPFFKDEHSMIYYDAFGGLVTFVPSSLETCTEFPLTKFAYPLSQRRELVHALEEYQSLLADRRLFYALQHAGFKITTKRLLLGTFSSFCIHTRHPNCIINYSDKVYMLHYRLPDQTTSRNTLPLEHPTAIHASHFLQRFVLDSELRGRADYKVSRTHASAQITSIAHLSSVKSITVSCMDDFRFEASLDIRDRFRDILTDSAFTSEDIESVLNWGYKRVALLALIQQARTLNRPVQVLSDDLVRIGDKEYGIGDKLECIIGMK